MSKLTCRGFCYSAWRCGLALSNAQNCWTVVTIVLIFGMSMARCIFVAWIQCQIGTIRLLFDAKKLDRVEKSLGSSTNRRLRWQPHIRQIMVRLFVSKWPRTPVVTDSRRWFRFQSTRQLIKLNANQKLEMFCYSNMSASAKVVDARNLVRMMKNFPNSIQERGRCDIRDALCSCSCCGAVQSNHKAADVASDCRDTTGLESCSGCRCHRSLDAI